MKHKILAIFLLFWLFAFNGEAYFLDKIKKKIENELEPMELPLFQNKFLQKSISKK